MRFIAPLLSTLAALALAAPAAAQVLYGATASGGPGELYVLNPATGGIVRDVGPLTDVSGANYPITGLAVHPVTGILYGSAANANAATRARLVVIDPLTARVTPVGPFNAGPTSPTGTPATMADLAFAPSGQLYGVASLNRPDLYAINLATGQATPVGASGVDVGTNGGGLAVSPGGVFYGTPTASRFGTYNPTTGAYTDLGQPTFPAGGGAYVALAFSGTALYGLNGAGPGTPATHLVTFNPATGAVTDIGPSVPALDAIAFAPAAVPEPGALPLTAAALAGLAVWRRRGSRRNCG
jgi:hypothetical protein